MSSTANYIAWRERRDLEDGALAEFQATAATEDAANTAENREVAQKVAELTNSRPAPPEVVADNRKLFDEAIDNAWVDKLRDSAPITLATLSDPKGTPLPKDQYDYLASVERAAGNLVAASKAIPDGTPWAGGWLNSPSLPNPELADEFADVRRQDDPERKSVPSVWDKPSEMPGAVQDGTMLNGGWADSPSIPRTNSRPSGDLAADAAAIRQQVDQQNDANPAPSGGQSNNNGLWPGEGLIEVEVIPDTGATSLPRSDPAARLTSGSGQPSPSSTGSGNSTSSTETGAGKGANGELQPGEIGIRPGGDASEPSDATSSMRGDPIAGPASGGEPTSSPSVGSGQVAPSAQGVGDKKLSGGLRPGESVTNVEVVPEPRAGVPNDNTTSPSSSVDVSAQSLPRGTTELSAIGSGPGSEGAPAFGQSLPFSSAMPLGPEFKTQIDLPEAPSTRASIALGIAKIGEKPDPQLLKAYKDLILRQPYIPQELALSVINGVADGSLSEGQALAKLTYTPPSGRETLADEVANAGRLTDEQARDLAERIKAQHDLPVDLGLQMLEWVRGENPLYGPVDAKNLLMATTDEELADLTDSIVRAKGKSPQEVEAIRRKIYEQNAIDPLLADDVLSKFLSGEKDENWARIALERQGLSDNIIEFIKQMPGGAIFSFGNIIQMAGDYLGMPETNESREEAALVKDILNLKGKSQSEFDAVHQRIVNAPRSDYLIGAWQAMKDGGDPKDVSQMFLSLPVGEGIRKYGEEFWKPRPGREHIVGAEMGRMAGPLISATLLGLINPWLGTEYLSLDAAASNHAEAAAKTGVNSDTTRKSDLWAAANGFVMNIPAGELIMKLPWLKKFAGGLVDRAVVSPSIDLGLQLGQLTGQNAIAKYYYDKDRDLSKDAALTAATSALLSGVKIAGGALFRRATAGSKPHYASLDPENAVAAAERAVGLKGRLEDLAAIVEPKIPQMRQTEKIRYVVDKKAFGTEVEKIFFKADTIWDFLQKTGIGVEEFTKGARITTSEFESAVKSGGYVQTTLGTFMADMMGTKLGDVALQHATFKPGEPSFAEGRALIDRLRKEQSGGTGAGSPEDKSTTSAAP